MNPNKLIKYSQPTAVPTPKVQAAGIGGSVSVVLIYIAKAFFDLEIPAEVASSLTTIIAVVAAYMTRDQKPRAAVEEIIKEDSPEKG